KASPAVVTVLSSVGLPAVEAEAFGVDLVATFFPAGLVVGDFAVVPDWAVAGVADSGFAAAGDAVAAEGVVPAGAFVFVLSALKTPSMIGRVLSLGAFGPAA